MFIINAATKFCFSDIMYRLLNDPHQHLVFHPFSCDLLEYGDDDEDPNDTTVTQMLAPRSHQEDATLILNNLLKDYDKTLRPDIGGEAGCHYRL